MTTPFASKRSSLDSSPLPDKLTTERHGMSECGRGLSVQRYPVLLLQLIAATQTNAQVHDADQTRDEYADHDGNEDVEIDAENDSRFRFWCSYKKTAAQTLH